MRLESRDRYLGPYGSPESHAEYERLIAEWRDEREKAARTVAPQLRRFPETTPRRSVTIDSSPPVMSDQLKHPDSLPAGMIIETAPAAWLSWEDALIGRPPAPLRLACIQDVPLTDVAAWRREIVMRCEEADLDLDLRSPSDRLSPDDLIEVIRKAFAPRLTYRHGGRDFRLTDVHGHVLHDILV